MLLVPYFLCPNSFCINLLVVSCTGSLVFSWEFRDFLMGICWLLIPIRKCLLLWFGFLSRVQNYRCISTSALWNNLRNCLVLRIQGLWLVNGCLKTMWSSLFSFEMFGRKRISFVISVCKLKNANFFFFNGLGSTWWEEFLRMPLTALKIGDGDELFGGEIEG